MLVSMWKVTLSNKFVDVPSSTGESKFTHYFFGTEKEALAYAREKKAEGWLDYYSVDEVKLPLTKATLLAIFNQGSGELVAWEDLLPGYEGKGIETWFPFMEQLLSLDE